MQQQNHNNLENLQEKYRTDLERIKQEFQSQTCTLQSDLDKSGTTIQSLKTDFHNKERECNSLMNDLDALKKQFTELDAELKMKIERPRKTIIDLQRKKR